MIGTFGGFFLAWIPFSFPAMIGIISLVGIVVNDAIVMIETMNKHRLRGLSVRQAAARGAADRLRPIVSTTITTVVGLVPLSLSSPMWDAALQRHHFRPDLRHLYLPVGHSLSLPAPDARQTLDRGDGKMIF